MRMPTLLALLAALALPARAEEAAAVLAGGCFWCLEEALDAVPGVTATVSGYVGGTVEHPTYAAVSAGRTGHTEAVRVTFDPARVSYANLLEVFWRNIDPMDPTGQFCDKGSQYRSGIFYLDDQQREEAERSRAAIVSSGRLSGPIATEITAAGPFWPAEESHQDYHLKNPQRYKYYKWACGRRARLDEIWGPVGG